MEIKVHSTGKVAAEELQAYLVNQCQTWKDLAELKTLAAALEAAIKQVAPEYISHNLHLGVGKQFEQEGELFIINDSPEYNFAANDNDGSYRLVLRQIENLRAESKTLTEEMKAAKARIIKNHPKMAVTHNYTLVYKGLAAELKK
ncbi:MAG: hypothetical protein MJZ59_05475 [Paludibacteraceae bacterium]|nr:hypothetical protein [Paludibacteraceae bacterium]